MATPLPGAGLLRALESDLPSERAETQKRIWDIEAELAALRNHLERLDAIWRAAAFSDEVVAP